MSDKTKGPFDVEKKISYSRLEDGPVIKKIHSKKQGMDKLTDIAWEAHQKLRGQGKTDAQLENNPFTKRLWGEVWGAEQEYEKLKEESGLGTKNGKDFFRWADKAELDDFAPTIAKRSKSGLKLVGKALPIIGTGLATAGALMAPDAAQAAVDFVVPGGVESMGVSPEQAELDKAYKARIRQRQESLNSLPH